MKISRKESMMKNPISSFFSRSVVFLLLAVAATVATASENRQDEVEVTPEMTFPERRPLAPLLRYFEGEPGKVNPGLGRAVAFLETMQAAGVPAERLKIAVVVHSLPVYDVSNASCYARQYGDVANPNEEVVAKLVAAGAEIWVCGVSAKYRGVGNSDLLPGVKVAHSAMTANAELQRRGFTLNPY